MKPSSIEDVARIVRTIVNKDNLNKQVCEIANNINVMFANRYVNVCIGSEFLSSRLQQNGNYLLDGCEFQGSDPKISNILRTIALVYYYKDHPTLRIIVSALRV